MFKLKKVTALAATTALLMQLSACGTILYPERKGQISGQLDTGVVVLNAIGLLFFFVPGVIAFAVDFNNGAIYLPGTSSSLNEGDLNVVTVDGELTQERIEQIVLEHTGLTVTLTNDHIVSTMRLASLDDVESSVKLL